MYATICVCLCMRVCMCVRMVKTGSIYELSNEFIFFSLVIPVIVKRLGPTVGIGAI